MEIIFNLESKWTKLSIKKDIRNQTFYDMSALKKLSLRTLSKEKDESHGLQEASHPNWGETKRIPRWKWNAIPQDDSCETGMERDQSILEYSRIPSKDFFRIIKSTDSEIHLDILRKDLDNFENVE